MQMKVIAVTVEIRMAVPEDTPEAEVCLGCSNAASVYLLNDAGNIRSWMVGYDTLRVEKLDPTHEETVEMLRATHPKDWRYAAGNLTNRVMETAQGPTA